MKTWPRTLATLLALIGLAIAPAHTQIQTQTKEQFPQILAPTSPRWAGTPGTPTAPPSASPKSRANADYMAAHLRSLGWQYIVVDIEWYTVAPGTHGYIPRGEVPATDPIRPPLPAPGRFPSAANGAGFKALADYIHSKGLKMGIHVMRGIPRDAVDKNLPIEGSQYHAGDIADKINVCHWKGMQDTYGIDMTKPGAQDYYDSIARLYASWALDYIKADDMSAPYHAAEIHAMSLALAKAGKQTGRPIVLSLSPGASPLSRSMSTKPPTHSSGASPETSGTPGPSSASSSISPTHGSSTAALPTGPTRTCYPSAPSASAPKSAIPARPTSPPTSSAP